MRSRVTDDELKAAVAASLTLTETIRRVGLRPAGGNHRSIRARIERLGISTAHFDPDAARNAPLRRPARPLEELLVKDSHVSRGAFKERLYAAGLKQRRCEFCGQGEVWRGRHMSLILDHVNGVADDNRLENLRIVCPNCNATLDTHCGKGLRKPVVELNCRVCDVPFSPKHSRQTCCSRDCGQRAGSLQRRTAERPPLDVLLRELEASSFSAVGRKYGVSDNAIRKWLRAYEREAAA